MFKKIKSNKANRLTDSSINEINEDAIVVKTTITADNKDKTEIKINEIPKSEENHELDPSKTIHDKEEKTIEISKDNNINIKINNHKTKRSKKGIILKVPDIIEEDDNHKNENSRISIKKIFLAETVLQNAKTPEDLKKLLGVNREEIEIMKEEKRKQLTEQQKDLFTLPDSLKVQHEKIDDHTDNLIRLSAAGK